MKVPRVSEFIASAKWKIEKCNDLKMNDNSCQSLFSIQQTYCDSPERRSKVDSRQRELKGFCYGLFR